MAIDIDNETLIHFTAAAREFPGRPVSIQTLHRYRLHGVHGAILESIKLSGRRFTSKEAVRRFIAAQNSTDATLAISPTQRALQSAAARRELENMGV